MTDILCKWLNTEVKLSRKTDPTTFAADFSSGFLLGELLFKFGLQNDFDQFSQNKTSDAKLNNFTRIEPTLHLLEISFDTNVAHDVMTERPSAAARLVYELFIALTKKQKKNLTGVAMETMRPAAPVKLDAISSILYKERLKHITPRQTDLDIDGVMSHFHQKQLEMEKVAFKERFEEQERCQRQLQEQRLKLMRQFKEQQLRNSETLAKIQAATVHLPKLPPSKTAKAIAQQRQLRKQKEAKEVSQEIAVFEAKQRQSLYPHSADVVGAGDMAAADVMASTVYDDAEFCHPGGSDEYINKIRQRLNDDVKARDEREKRRRKVLIEQLTAHEAQEEARREDVLVSLCMRQSIQERRITVQLMHVRHEKENIRRNRLTKEKQFEECRVREFQEALDREAELLKLHQLENEEQIRQDRQLHEQLVAERLAARYSKHYDFCSQIVSDIIDFTMKVGEYREFTNKLVPVKFIRNWTELFVAGKPLYEPDETAFLEELPTDEQILEDERHRLLNDADFMEYKNMTGEWVPPDGFGITAPPRDNPVLGHVVHRLLQLVRPQEMLSGAPMLPPCPIKMCLLGKTFSGKSSCCEKLAQAHNLAILRADVLVAEAIEAFKSGEHTEESASQLSFDESMMRTMTEGLDLPSSKTQNSDASDVPVAPFNGSHEAPAKGHEVAKSHEPTVVKLRDSLVNSHDAVAKAHDDNRNSDLPMDSALEKSDPEKPVPAGEFGEMNEEKKQQVKMEEEEENDVEEQDEMNVSLQPSSTGVRIRPTRRAELGEQAVGCLNSGQAVTDELLVNIIIAAIEVLPEGTGWILDGFPTTLTQAVLLEKALSGYDAIASHDALLDVDESSDSSSKNKKLTKSSLVADPRPPPPPAEPKSGIDLVVVLDVSDEVCLRRAAVSLEVSGSLGVLQPTSEQMEMEQVSISMMESDSQQQLTVRARDTAHDKDQMQQRILTFNDEWPTLKQWFGRFDILKSVGASDEMEVVADEVQVILQQTLKKLKGGEEDEEKKYIFTPEELGEPKAAEPEQIPSPTPMPEQVSSARSASRHEARAGSAAKKKADSKQRMPSPKASPKKGAKERQSGKKGKKEEPEPQPELPTGPPPPQPGSDEWQFVDRAIDMELAEVLTEVWEGVESSYVTSTKKAFYLIRSERDQIIRYLYEIRKDFVKHVNRPDHKQEFVSQWQKDYNSVPDDMRGECEVRADLHQRIDDVRDRLWNISDERKEQAEAERLAVMSNGWLEDHLGLLDNHYITLMQAEVDRFQDTVALLRDYYRGMEGRPPDEATGEYARVPLVELPESVPVRADISNSIPQLAAGASPAASEAEGKSTIKSPLKKHKSTTNTPEPQDGSEEHKMRIPFIQRRTASPEVSGKSKLEKSKQAKTLKETDEVPSTPDIDERLLSEVHTLALSAVDKICLAETAAREAEEEAERQRLAAEEVAKRKAAAAEKKRGARAKDRSPSPKKGKGKETPTTPTPQVEEPEDVKQKRLEEEQAKIDRERGKQEYFAAVSEEGTATKQRLDLIKAVAIMVVQDLKVKSEATYSDMNDWIGIEFLQEMESIDQLCEIMRHAVESGEKIHKELMLQRTELVISEDVLSLYGKDVKLLRTPSPPPVPEPVEESSPDTFTIDQLVNLFQQFAAKQKGLLSSSAVNSSVQLVQPTNSSIIPIRTFTETIQSLMLLNQGTEWLPASWMHLSADKLEQMAMQLSPDGEHVDWRRFMLQAAQPWPTPTEADLLQALDCMRDMDQRNSGFIMKEQFERVEIWLQSTKVQTPLPSDVLPTFDRLSHLRPVIFDILADHTVDPPLLDYIQMLMYFSIATEPYEGFLRALTVTTGTHMPRLPLKLPLKKLPQGSSTEMTATEMKPLWPQDVPESADDALVPLDALHRVLCHGQSCRADSFRAPTTEDSEDPFSRDRLAGIYEELGGSEDLRPLPLSLLLEHTVIQDVVSACTTYKAIDVRAMVVQPEPLQIDVNAQ